MKDSQKVESSTGIAAAVRVLANATPSIRELMPAGFLPKLAKACKAKNISYLSQVVSLENTDSSHWPEVVKLAKETNPAGFAQWEAARAQPA